MSLLGIYPDPINGKGLFLPSWYSRQILPAAWDYPFSALLNGSSGVLWTDETPGLPWSYTANRDSFPLSARAATDAAQSWQESPAGCAGMGNHILWLIWKAEKGKGGVNVIVWAQLFTICSARLWSGETFLRLKLLKQSRYSVSSGCSPSFFCGLVK